MILFKFHYVVHTGFKECIMWETLDLVFTTVTRKSFNGKFTVKIDFVMGNFIILGTHH